MRYLIQIYSKLDYLTEVEADTLELAANQAMLNLRNAMDGNMIVTGARPELAITPDGNSIKLVCTDTCVLT